MAIALALVICSGVLHAIWNLLAKRSRDKLAFLFLANIVAVVLFLPLVVGDLGHIQWSAPAILLLFLSMLFHGVYVVLLGKTYAIGDLSQVYPIMRGTSPLVVPLVGVTFLGEHLPLWGWCGIGLVIIGIVLLSDIQLGQNVTSKAVFSAFAVGLCIATYIVVDKLALAYIPIFPLNAATNIANASALAWFAVRAGTAGDEWRLNKGSIIFVGIISAGGYMLFLVALHLVPVAALAPMREIGTAIGALLGVWLLKESKGTKRIFAASLITAGVILIGLLGEAG